MKRKLKMTITILAAAAMLSSTAVLPVNAANTSCKANTCENNVTSTTKPFIADVKVVSESADNSFVVFWTSVSADGYVITVYNDKGKQVKSIDVSNPESTIMDVDMPKYEDKKVYNTDGTYYYLREATSYTTYKNSICNYYQISLPDGFNNITVRAYNYEKNGSRCYGYESDSYSLICYGYNDSGSSCTTGDCNNINDKTDHAHSDTPAHKHEQDIMLDIINTERNKEGLPSLSLDSDLCRAAQIRAVEISGYFSHTRPDGRDCFTVFDDLGLSRGWLSENIAMGMTDAASAMSAWMNSSGHRANILGKNYTRVGIGYDADSRSWVQIFAS